MAVPFIDWLASYPKSGNTWVRALLDAYRYQHTFNVNNMTTVVSEPKRHVYLGMWQSTNPFEMYDWACMRGPALCHAAIARPEDQFLVKTHTANMQVDDMPMIPAGYSKRAVYIVRDPRDVLVSSAKYFRNDYRSQWKTLKNPEHSLGEWDSPSTWQPCSSLKLNVMSWAKEDRFPVLMVRYEDLLADTAGEFTKILKHYQIDVDNSRVARAVELTQFDRLKKAEKSSGFRDNLDENVKNDVPFFRSGTAGQWETELPEDLALEVYEEFKDIEHLWSKKENTPQP